MDLFEEVFLPVLEADGRYEISNKGRIKSLYFHGNARKHPIYLRPGLSSGYYTVVFCVGGVRRTYSIHRLKATYFIPNPKRYSEINHKDGDRTNNELSNLEWCSRKQNIRHYIQVLDKNNGCKSPFAMFTETQLADIMSLRKKGKARTKDLAKLYNCTPSAISNICAGRRYKKEYKKMKIK